MTAESVEAAIAPYLASLDHRQLTAEQRVRVRRIVAAVSRDTLDDSVEHIVSWLAWDAKAWYLLLSRDDEALRQAAAAQLAGLLDEPLDFDPAADAATRQQQLERLRPLFELPPAAEAADEPAEDE